MDTTEPFDDHPYVRLFRPRAIVPRIIVQHGLFTIHPDPNAALEEGTAELSGFEKMIVPQDKRSTLLAELSYYGVNSTSLFPDLDGLSQFVNWAIESGEYFRR